MKSFIVSGTDTGIGKTLLSAMLMAALPEYYYWKPIQSGMLDGTDSEATRRLSGCSPNRILPEAYVFSEPLSPHAAAAIDGVTIEKKKLGLPDASPLLIEGAGGLLVPLTEDLLYIDIFKFWELPVLLVCRSGLGTINHSLLSIEALRKRDIPILGCVLIGERNVPNEQAIEQYGAVDVIGYIPLLSSFEPNALKKVFETTLKEFKKKSIFR
ncbi:MAG TPA: dethiobiotin synthase [Candidatus Kapabacteria bacterium]|nr:dethiobiotin synthase [Candidatus Kapabacteria bacterium]